MSVPITAAAAAFKANHLIPAIFLTKPPWRVGFGSEYDITWFAGPDPEVAFGLLDRVGDVEVLAFDLDQADHGQAVELEGLLGSSAK